MNKGLPRLLTQQIFRMILLNTKFFLLIPDPVSPLSPTAADRKC